MTCTSVFQQRLPVLLVNLGLALIHSTYGGAGQKSFPPSYVEKQAWGAYAIICRHIDSHAYIYLANRESWRHILGICMDVHILICNMIITAFHTQRSYSGHVSKEQMHHYISDINSTVITYHLNPPLIRGMPSWPGGA